MSCRGWKAFAFVPMLILLAAIRVVRAQKTAAWDDFQQKAAVCRALPAGASICSFRSNGDEYEPRLRAGGGGVPRPPGNSASLQP